jgi:hypothetical protein
MSIEYVNQVTLECLMNKDTYKKYVATKKKSVVNKKDQKFYRRRILSLTKELLYPEETTPATTATTPEKPTTTTTTKPATTINDPNIVGLFQIYSKACIEYFKSLDTNDIIQDDYSSLTPETTEMRPEDIKTQADIDQQFMRSIHVKEATTLDKFVKRNTTAPKEDQILPKQKDINLRDPALKNKGIRKKKNITNKYEEEESKTKNTESEANK